MIVHADGVAVTRVAAKSQGSTFACLLVLLAIASPVRAQDVPRIPDLPPIGPPSPPSAATRFQIPPNTIELPPASPPTLPPLSEQYLQEGSQLVLPQASKQQLRFSPRYGTLGKFDFVPIGDGGQRLVYTGGLVVNAIFTPPPPSTDAAQEYEFAADNVVLWIKGDGANTIVGDNLRTNGMTVDPPAEKQSMQVELYLTGNVIIRTRDRKILPSGSVSYTDRVVRADSIYYDLNKSKAIALNADLEIKLDRFPDSVHITGDRITRLGMSEWIATRGQAYSSKLPSDPKVRFRATEVDFVERETTRTNIFGLPYRKLPTLEDDYGVERTITARNATATLLGVPIFYSPRLKMDPAEPLGPLLGVGFGNDNIFGFQALTTWDVYKLLGLRAPQGHNWRFQYDYFSMRGNFFGTEYDYRNRDFFGFAIPNSGTIRLYGINDAGPDNLGTRGVEPFASQKRIDDERVLRGRALWRNQAELLAERDENGVLQSSTHILLQNQFAYQSDKNFFEQYFKLEFDNGPNQETFSYLSGTSGRVFGSLLAQHGFTRDWMTETRWLPKASAAIVGQSFFDRLTYHSRVEGAYAELRPTTIAPFAIQPTERTATNTGRVDWFNELAAPLNVGPLKLTPYGVVDVTGYSRDLAGQDVGRVYGGGGVRAAMTFSRLYPDISSELFNIRGLNHKATWHANYFNARSNVDHTRLPQLDRLNEDIIDFAYRTMTPMHASFLKDPAAVRALTTAEFFNPQRYAIRRLVDTRVDTRDDLEVVQLGLDQRWQTKRGKPGKEHTVDWLTLDLSTSLFPRADQDNFGKSAAFFEYYTAWNVGDQTGLSSYGWFDPFMSGARYWNVVLSTTRPNKVGMSLAYRQTDPVNSKSVVFGLSYPLTRKYTIGAFTMQDFGTQIANNNSIQIMRTGTDLTIAIGIGYNQVQNNTTFQFSIVPNLAASAGLMNSLTSPLFNNTPR
jgi:hypothetical protein